MQDLAPTQPPLLVLQKDHCSTLSLQQKLFLLDVLSRHLLVLKEIQPGKTSKRQMRHTLFTHQSTNSSNSMYPLPLLSSSFMAAVSSSSFRLTFCCDLHSATAHHAPILVQCHAAIVAHKGKTACVLFQASWFSCSTWFGYISDRKIASGCKQLARTHQLSAGYCALDVVGYCEHTLLYAT